MEEIKKADTIGEKQRLESLHGTRYSVLTELPYVDLIKMAVVDPMHNLFLGMSSFNKLSDLRDYGGIDCEQLKIRRCWVYRLLDTPSSEFKNMEEGFF